MNNFLLFLILICLCYLIYNLSELLLHIDHKLYQLIWLLKEIKPILKDSDENVKYMADKVRKI